MTTPPTRKAPEVKTPNKSTVPKIRGFNEITPFLHEVSKIVSEECSKHESPQDFDWYTTWTSWNVPSMFTKKSMNYIVQRICPEVKYPHRTIRTIVNKITTAISPILTYIEIVNLSDTSVKWEIDSFKSVV